MSRTETNPQLGSKLAPRCPRCGYDLRGAIETWKHECPINGVCTECGLEFEWAELLSSKIRKPQWCVEYGRCWTLPWRMVLNIGYQFWPWGFWASLKMTHRIRRRRIAAYLTLVLPLMYFIFCGWQGISAWSEYKDHESQPGFTMNFSVSAVFLQSLALPFSDKSPGMYTATTSVNTFGPITFNSDGTTNPATPNSVTRISTHSFQSPRERIHRICRFDHIYSFMEIWPQVMLGSGKGSIWRLNWEYLSGLLSVTFIFALLCPLGFVLLPESRKVARVLPEHIVRITLYSFAFPVVVLVYLISFILLRRNLGLDFTDLHRQVRYFCLYIFPIMQVIWWSTATDRYLKIPHAWGVGASVVTIAFLLCPALLLTILIFIATYL